MSQHMVFGKWHIWRVSEIDRIMVSNEETKALNQFRTKDAAVNFLWLAGDVEAAKELNRSFV